jgi:hypothetical protein
MRSPEYVKGERAGVVEGIVVGIVVGILLGVIFITSYL